MTHDPESLRRRKIGVLVVLACIAVIAFAAMSVEQQASARSEPGRVELTWLEERKIRKAVAEQLRDPDSARFDALHARLNEDGVIQVCGLVAGRNAFGGMARPEPFFTYFGPRGQVGFVVMAGRPVTAGMCLDEGIIMPITFEIWTF